MDQFSRMVSPVLPPGFSIDRLTELMKRSIATTELNLSDATVLTEAASGAYGVTAVVAAMAGAKEVHAFARPTRYGSVLDISNWITLLGTAVGVMDRINIIEDIPPHIIKDVDIVTNSGNLRPIKSDLIDCLPSSAVIALMFEAWEFRASDVDFQACTKRGIPLVGVNENHEAVDVFAFLGPLSVKQLHDCGLSVYRNRIALLCDNGFADPIQRGLIGLGADVSIFSKVSEVYSDDWDAVILALLPTAQPHVGDIEAQHLAAITRPYTAIVQFWGDIDRISAMSRGLSVWPTNAPLPGHMGILLSEVGPEPIVRLQTGGLRAAEWIWRGGAVSATGFAQIVQPE